MKLSCLSLALAIILVLAIMYSPHMEVKALAGPEPDAIGFADAFGEADAKLPKGKWGKGPRILGKDWVKQWREAMAAKKAME